MTKREVNPIAVRKNRSNIYQYNKMGKRAAFPQDITEQFVVDAMYLYYMSQASTYGDMTCGVHGQLYQEEMAARYPQEWMFWLFEKMEGPFLPFH